MPRLGIKKNVRKLFNPSRWVGKETLGLVGKQALNGVRSFFTIQQPERTETYEEAIQRLKLTPEAIAIRKGTFFRMACFYAVFATLVLFYHIYCWWNHHYVAALMTFSIVAVLYAFAFKEHFWYTQMKVERLGLSLSQWFLITIGEDHESS